MYIYHKTLRHNRCRQEPPANSDFCKLQALTGCNKLLLVCEKPFSVFHLEADFSSRQKSLQLIGVLASTGVKENLEKNGFKTIETVLPFLAAFIGRRTEHTAVPVIVNG